MKVGISPFGIWRPGYPPGIRGFDAVQRDLRRRPELDQRGLGRLLRAATLLEADAPQQPYDDLLGWWVDQNTLERHIWPGLFTSRAGNVLAAPEIIDEVERTRGQPGASGNVHFSMKALLSNQDSVATRLATQSIWNRHSCRRLHGWNPECRAPTARVQPDSLSGRTVVSFSPTGTRVVRLWVVQAHAGDRWFTRFVPGTERRGCSPSTPPPWFPTASSCERSTAPE